MIPLVVRQILIEDASFRLDLAGKRRARNGAGGDVRAYQARLVGINEAMTPDTP